MLEDYDIHQWVDNAPKKDEEFRQAVHTILAAIANEPKLNANMVIKGGILLAIRYHSHRYTKDIDLSTSKTLLDIKPEEIETKLNESLSLTSLELEYDLDCRVQRLRVEPSENATFPNLKIKIGYAYKGTPKHKRLEANRSPTVISVDYSLNEFTPNLEKLEVGAGGGVFAYTLTDLVAEKLRSLIQQVERNRYRRQDIFDLHLILERYQDLDEVELEKIHSSLVEKSKSRGIEVTSKHLDNDEVKERARKDYHTLEDEIEGDLPDFDACYEQVQEFYHGLPWSE